VTWDTIVIHWLTFGSSAVAERDLIRSTQVSMRASLIQRSTSTMDGKDDKLGGKLAAHLLPREPPSALTPSAVVVDVWKDCAADTIPSAPLRGYEKKGEKLGLVH
jgi:hypothetical protein